MSPWYDFKYLFILYRFAALWQQLMVTNADGYVAAPDINLAEEQMNLIRAETAYKATASLIPVVKDMYEELINAVDKNA